MFTEIITLLEQSFDLMAVLASGYISYRIAYADKDSSHAAVDVVFTSLVFAAISKMGMSAALYSFSAYGISAAGMTYMAAVSGLFVSVAAASCWRAFGERWTFEALRRLGVSSSDRHRNVMHTIIARQQDPGPSSLFVRCADGSRLLCERLADFEKLPFGPCLLGTDGSVALYVTHRKPSANGEWEADQDVADTAPDWGRELTYLPAPQVVEVRLCYPFSPSVLAVRASMAQKASVG